MPGSEHEALVELFRRRDTLAVTVLERVLGVDVPAFDAIASADSDMSQLRPAAFSADLAQVLTHDGRAVLGILVEPQLRVDPRKRFSWPVYATTLRARYACPSVVVVVTPEPSVAEWAATPIEVMPGQTLTPWVLGPGTMPLLGPDAIARSPVELVALSALSHRGRDEARGPVLGAAARLRELDDDLRSVVHDMLMAAASDAVREELRAMARLTEWEWKSDFYKEKMAEGLRRGLVQGLEQGRAQGLEQGREQGLEQGLEQGREQGLEEGREQALKQALERQRTLLLKLLARRDVPLDETLRARIGAADSSTLERWQLALFDGEAPEKIFSDE